jgi:hypothetical protein
MSNKRRLEQIEQHLSHRLADVEPDERGMYPPTYEGWVAAHRDYWRRWWRSLTDDTDRLSRALDEKRDFLIRQGQSVTDADFARAHAILSAVQLLPDSSYNPQQTAKRAVALIESDLIETFRWFKVITFVGAIMCETYPANLMVIPYRREEADYAAAIIYARLKYLAEFGTHAVIDEVDNGIVLYAELGFLARVYLEHHAHTPQSDHVTQQRIIRAQRVAAIAAAMWDEYSRVMLGGGHSAAIEQALKDALEMPDGMLIA